LLIKKQRPDLLKGKETPALMPSTKKLKEKLKRKKNIGETFFMQRRSVTLV
jgi:hypothetical protein